MQATVFALVARRAYNRDAECNCAAERGIHGLALPSTDAHADHRRLHMVSCDPVNRQRKPGEAAISVASKSPDGSASTPWPRRNGYRRSCPQRVFRHRDSRRRRSRRLSRQKPTRTSTEFDVRGANASVDNVDVHATAVTRVAIQPAVPEPETAHDFTLIHTIQTPAVPTSSICQPAV